MGQQELKEALQQEAEVRARQLWREAEDHVAKRREEIQAEVERLEQEAEQRLQAKIKTLRAELLQDALGQALTCRLRSEVRLAERLHRLAEACLAELTAKDRARLWPPLKAELPPGEWGQVHAHPDDSEKAREEFPGADVVPDQAIAAGLRVVSEDQKVWVDNTLNSRLERAWTELLPAMLAEIREMVDKDETAGTDPAG